jgi:peroxiredoxin
VRWLLVLTLLVAGCGSASGGDGGRDALPGPVPKGVTYASGGGPAAPAFTVSLLDGTRVSSASLWKERPLVVFFFDSWCSRCASQQQTIANVAKRYGDAVAVVGLAGRDTNGTLKPWLSKHGVGYPVAIDPELETWKRYAVLTPPAVVLIGRGGSLLRGWTDGVSERELNRQLQQIVHR